MPLNRTNVRTFHRHLFAGQLEKVVVKKRDDNQQQGTVTSHILYSCRWSLITRTGETLAGDMLSDHQRTLHVPRMEMKRIGVDHFNPADRFIDIQGRVWQPESTTTMTGKLWEQHIDVDCVRRG